MLHSTVPKKLWFIWCTLLQLVLAVVSLALLPALATAQVDEPALQITNGQIEQHLSRTALLKHPALRTIHVPSDVAYGGRAMSYQAVPLTGLTGPITGDNLQCIASDGFVSNIPAQLLEGGAGKSEAWIAIEPADAPWPALKPGAASAGPFYLVWLAPAKSGIADEQWPYKLVHIATALTLEVRYPQILPRTVQVADSPERRGLQVFLRHCAVCHPINGGGDTRLGPDLNRPFSPVEYFQEPFLRRLVRDSSSVRNWPQRNMPPFPVTELHDAALDDLLAYLRVMARERARD
jgi:mono/diheme cytochrome c family protein